MSDSYTSKETGRAIFFLYNYKLESVHLLEKPADTVIMSREF